MDKLDEIALITFITCDVILENFYEIKYFYKKFVFESKDIMKRLFK